LNEKGDKLMVEANRSFEAMKQAFEEHFPLDECLAVNRYALQSRLEVFKYFELRRIADALEKLAEGKK
jgi:hypothetical protein